VRIDVIDRQHQALIALTRDPQEAVGREGRAFQIILIDRLVAHTNEHLRFEENMLSEHNYESLAQHVEQHQVYMEWVAHGAVL
jgi:hemerythrin-like metal-binding protein